MNGKQLRRDRERLRVSRTELALAAGIPRDDVAGWERSGASIPRQVRGRVVASLAAANRARLLEGCGLPECGWAADRNEPAERGPEARAHVAACELCQARERYADERAYIAPTAFSHGGRLAPGRVLDLLAVASGPSLTLVWAGVVIILLGLARLLRHLPFHELLVLVVYPFALLLAAVVGVGVYTALAPLHERGAVTQWIARCVACMGASVGFASMFVISGYGRTLGRHGGIETWGEAVAMGMIVGFLYATVWPLVASWRRVG